MYTQEKLDDIKYMLRRNHTTPEEEISKMISEGYSDQNANQIVTKIIKEIRQEQFNQRVEHEDNEAKNSIARAVIVISAMIGPVFGIASPFWYLVVIIIAVCAGYYGYPKKPLAGAIGGLIFVILLPFTYEMYFANRTSFIRIEMAIPMLIAALPAFIGYYIASFFYSKS